ncbi:energy transducer TonB [Massilia pinisoli]|uniref:Energy transducer TonB n=1 Tax=Massilia pinisoli TaxID=1772194 RepID=A0ABT1ZWU6_9BURK|nr:energy transducer TonB [Massilia pinisoli]MCS0584074.1 energy transducer TonB [Massilia pinisoli]
MICSIRALTATFGLLVSAGMAQAQTRIETTSLVPPQQVPASVCVKPAYPIDALRAEAAGVVTMRFLIGADGAVQETRLVKSSGHASLDHAAIDALSKCRFKPAAVDGKLVEHWQEVKYTWSLD